MAKIEKTTETTIKNTYKLTLTEFEAQCLRSLLGHMTGFGKANTALGNVWTALYDADVGLAPMKVSDTPSRMYVTDTTHL